MQRSTSVQLLASVGVDFPPAPVRPRSLAASCARGAAAARPQRCTALLCLFPVCGGEGGWEVEVDLPANVGSARRALAPAESGLEVRAVEAGTAPGVARLRLGTAQARPGWWPVLLNGDLGCCEVYIKVNERGHGRTTEP